MPAKYKPYRSATIVMVHSVQGVNRSVTAVLIRSLKRNEIIRRAATIHLKQKLMAHSLQEKKKESARVPAAQSDRATAKKEEAKLIDYSLRSTGSEWK